MRIILSAHFDLNKPVKYIKVGEKNLEGLVDNFAGVFAAYEASRKTGVELFLTNFEEKNLGGAIALSKDLKGEKPIVIVVDTCTDAEDKKAYIGNAYGIDTTLLKKKFGKKIYFKDGYFEPTEDETAVYGWDEEMPAFFFGIPITGKYHDVHNSVSLKTINEASKVLVDVINWLRRNYSKILISK